MLFEDSFPAIEAEPDNNLNPFSNGRGKPAHSASKPRLKPAIVRTWLRNPDAPLPTVTEEDEGATHTMKSFNPSMESFQQMSDLELFLKKFEGKRVYIKAERGKLLAACSKCGNGRFKHSASVEGVHNDPASIWTVKRAKNKISLTNANGKRLCSCSRCWDVASYNNAAFVQSLAEADSSQAAQWIPVKHSNNKWLFRSDRGTYLGVCKNCVPSAKFENFAFIHMTHKNPLVYWEISLVDRKSSKKSKKASDSHNRKLPKKHKTEKSTSKATDKHKKNNHTQKRKKPSAKGIFSKKSHK